jgi:hypothetical protein
MRKALFTLTLGLTIAVGATAYLAANTSIWAQGCQGSCSNAELRCKRFSGDSAECAKAYKKCLKTGTFTGVKSGTTFTNVCKT